MTPEEMLIIIDYNKDVLSKPHHVNKNLMLCALQMEKETNDQRKERNKARV